MGGWPRANLPVEGVISLSFPLPCIEYQTTCIGVCRVEIWPGFIASILSYERSVMLCAEISHKILRTITVLEMMYDLYASARRDFHAEATRKLVGTIIMTR